MSKSFDQFEFVRVDLGDTAQMDTQHERKESENNKHNYIKTCIFDRCCKNTLISVKYVPLFNHSQSKYFLLMCSCHYCYKTEGDLLIAKR